MKAEKIADVERSLQILKDDMIVSEIDKLLPHVLKKSCIEDTRCRGLPTLSRSIPSWLHGYILRLCSL